MNKVYVVMGEAGSYSDHRMWQVKAYISEQAAESMCEKLNTAVTEWHTRFSDRQVKARQAEKDFCDNAPVAKNPEAARQWFKDRNEYIEKIAGPFEYNNPDIEKLDPNTCMSATYDVVELELE